MQREQELAVGERHLDVELRDLLDAGRRADPRRGSRSRSGSSARSRTITSSCLEICGRLRQREEAAGLQARGTRKSRAPSGVGLPDDRRLDVDEAGRPPSSRRMIDRRAARAGGCCAASARGAGRASGSACARLVDALLVELERQRRRAREDLELGRLQLDLAGRHRRVDRLRRAARRRCRAPGRRTRCAARAPSAAASGALSGLITSWTTPPWSRRSTKTSPPWSRRRRDPAGERDLTAHVVGTELAAI